MLAKALTAAALAAVVSASSVDVRARDWKLVRRADAAARKTFSVAMPFTDYPSLEAELLTVSNPKNPRYGQWLDLETVNKYMATPAAIADEVYDWATSTGAQCLRLVNSLRCEGSVAQVEQLLSTELSLYMHKETSATVVRTSAAATVPDHLKEKVVMVTGLVNLPVPRLGNKRSAEAIRKVQDTDYTIVPYTLTTLYSVTTQDGNSKSTMAATEFQDYPAPVSTDSSTFVQNVKINPIVLNKTVGTFDPEPAAESALDVQYISAMGQGNTEWYWTEADWMYEFATSLSNLTTAQMPSVFSMSYAWYEGDQCQISPSAPPCVGKPTKAGSYLFVAQVNALFAGITARGITFLSASGDSGAHGRTDPGCTHKVVRPDFPAASPWVTAVGATELENGVTGSVPEPICQSQLQCATGGYEIVASNEVLAFFSSGGGFSNVAPQPSWQSTVVNKYLQNTTAQPPAGDFNATGRGYPDIAALGHNYYIELGGEVTSVDGTSCATPVVAGLVADLNAWRLSQGKPLLGFFNPLLYQIYATNPKSFTDVVQGDNTCTEDACPCPAGDGYYAAPGWDACTGLGTPVYSVMKATIASMGI
jgi:tripeptidyl-peptidase-1